jgi:hypothetical protein
MSTNKFYTENQIYVATFLGGPIPAGILVFQNLKKLEEQRLANAVLMGTVVFTILLFLGIMQIPDHIFERIPSLAFTALYTVFVFVLYRRYLANRVNAELVEKDNRASNWSVAGYGFLGLMINLVIIFAIGSSQPAFPGEKMTFGSLEHEVFYNAENTDPSTVENVARVLAEEEVFDEEGRIAVHLEEYQDLLVLSMAVNRQFWSDADLMSDYANLKEHLQSTLGKKVRIDLIHYTLNGENEIKKI